MHESHLVGRLIEQASAKSREHGGARIAKLAVVAGELLNFDETSVKMHFEALSDGTPLEGAEISARIARARLKCRDCGRAGEKKKGVPECPFCSSSNVTLESGREFEIESIEFLS